MLELIGYCNGPNKNGRKGKVHTLFTNWYFIHFKAIFSPLNAFPNEFDIFI